MGSQDDKLERPVKLMPRSRSVSVGSVTGQPQLTEQAKRTGATTTDPKVNARAVDAGVKVDPRTGEVSERGPVGEELHTQVSVADAPLFVKVGGGDGKRRLVGDDLPEDDVSHVLFLAGDVIPAEFRDLPQVAAVHRCGVWMPADQLWAGLTSPPDWSSTLPWRGRGNGRRRAGFPACVPFPLC
jgi:hypothetical protein